MSAVSPETPDSVVPASAPRQPVSVWTWPIALGLLTLFGLLSALLGQHQAFNIVNGDVFRWKWLWPQLAAWFGFEAAPYPGQAASLEAMLSGDVELWAEISGRHGLKETQMGRLASAWHTDADLGRPVECVTDMSKSRRAGFTAYQYTPGSFFNLLPFHLFPMCILRRIPGTKKATRLGGFSSVFSDAYAWLRGRIASQLAATAS